MDMRLGIFGGSFDPIHYGHLLIAEICREQCTLEEVWFVPAAVPPHKQGQNLASPSQRVEMLRLAISGHSNFRVATIELDRGGVSYTLETLQEIRQQQPDAELFLLMGADSLKDLPTWREPRQICELAVPIIVRRFGSPEPRYDLLANVVDAERLREFEEFQVEMPVVDFSSRDIRRRVSQKRSIRYQTPRAVEKYIETQGLYANQ
jgi:nicotinate-nucleotide adenylyltransferase